jgi:hypothetical protein
MMRKLLPARSFIFISVLLIGLAFIVAACAGGAAATEEPAAPAPEEPVVAPQQTSSAPTQLAPTQPVPATYVPAIPERRRLTLEFPQQIRIGDSDRVRLTLEVDDAGNIIPTAEVEGNVVTGEVVEIPNLYETHNVIAEAKFDIAGLQVVPPETISQTLSQGQSVTFYWSVLPKESGVYRGTIWFYLRFVDKVSGAESQKTVSAQLVEIEAVSLLGLPLGVVKRFGGVGSVIGAILGFPFIDDILKFILGRRKVHRK